MTLETLAQKTLSTVIVDNPGAEISAAYSSDLLSDVMGHCGDESALITIQNHLNTIAVCTLVGIEAIVICHDRPIPDDMAEAAKREEVAIITTPMSQFEASVALAELPAARK
jgi:serine kinase of HPr protein (carbohydrate metabolism regulator)